MNRIEAISELHFKHFKFHSHIHFTFPPMLIDRHALFPEYPLKSGRSVPLMWFYMQLRQKLFSFLMQTFAK